MLPEVEDDLMSDFDYQSLPSYTYKLDIDKSCIRGYCDSLVAIKQAIYKILNTERYENKIYSWNYGVELRSLYGKPTSYVVSELKRRIKEALVEDDRIDSVDGFEFENDKENILVRFMVHSNLGDFNYEVEVNV